MSEPDIRKATVETEMDDQKMKRLKVLYRIETGIFIFIIVVCFAIILFRIFGPTVIRVSGDSMYPNYNDGEFVLCEECGSLDDLERGDVVIVKRPDKKQRYVIKRVIGLPGETIQVNSEGVFVNGEVLDEPYEKTVVYGVAEEGISLSQDECFVMGDNRNHSADSRVFGPVGPDEVQYKVVRVISLLNIFNLGGAQ